MTGGPSAEPGYVAGRLQEALAHVGETDVHVTINGSRIVLTGNVTTLARRDEVVSVVRASAEGYDVADQVTVLRALEPSVDGQEPIS